MRGSKKSWFGFVLSLAWMSGGALWAAESPSTQSTNNAPAAAVVGPWALSTRVFKLNHVSAEDVATRFNEMWSGDFGARGRVAKMAVPFPESNAVMVTAPEAVIESCAQVVASLDVSTQQVYIEVRFVELGNAAAHKLGIDWSMLGGMGGSIKLGGGIEMRRLDPGITKYETVSGGGEFSHKSVSLDGTKGDAGTTYFTGTMDFSQLYLTLRALESESDARIFSNPKIIVSSGKKAIVDMTTKYPNVSIAAKKTINNNNESVDIDMKMAEIPGEDKFMFAKEAFFSWGIALEVTPRILTNGLINVCVVPTISSCDDFVTAGTATSSSEGSSSYSSRYPIIEVQRLMTEFNMASSTTAVIGGLSRTEERQVDNGIPYLRKIPWLGSWLFGSSQREKVQKEIIVFVTVGTVDPNNMAKDAGLPKNAVLGRQYTQGLKREPGDREARNMEGVGSLDLRLLDQQAHDPILEEEQDAK